MSCYYITATDTDAGKTYVTSLLLQQARLSKISALGLKPIASGIVENEITDLDLIIAAMANKNSQTDINYYQYKPAIAPHLAAKQNNETIDSKQLVNWINQKKSCDLTLIEGVGGLLVPLNDTETQVDLIKQLDIPVIVVVNIKTGCINHALLTFNQIKASGLTMKAWIANQVKNDIDLENIQSIENFSGTRCALKIAKQKTTSEEFYQQLLSDKTINNELNSFIYQL
ncbi:MAG: dethiobiotin synthase [Gammaproteobacteria bacterium]|nr:dethiobiotin synthase [Gammaproteobacteria bacterium]